MWLYLSIVFKIKNLKILEKREQSKQNLAKKRQFSNCFFYLIPFINNGSFLWIILQRICIVCYKKVHKRNNNKKKCVLALRIFFPFEKSKFIICTFWKKDCLTSIAKQDWWSSTTGRKWNIFPGIEHLIPQMSQPNCGATVWWESLFSSPGLTFVSGCVEIEKEAWDVSMKSSF